MSDFPVIRTAIPKRRYQLGDYSISVLGDIESGDGREYRFIMAFVATGKGQPELFVCSERNRKDGSHSLRAVNSAMSEILGSDDSWKDMEPFCDQALRLGRQMLGLGPEEAVQIA